ncbi:MAG: LEA type 2 family protein [Bacteroidota bacterium]
MRIVKAFVFLVIIGFIIVVILYYVFNPKKAVNLILPNLNEVSYVHIDMKKDSALIKLFALVQNKMPYKIVIDTIHFEIKLNDFTLSEETIPVQIDQGSFDKDTVEIPINLSIKKIKQVIGDLQEQDSTYMDVNVYVVYNTFIGQEKLNYNKRIKIASPIPPQIKVVKVEHKKYNFRNKRSEAIIKIEIINKGKYIDLQLNDIEYDLQIKNTLFSKGIIKRSINVKPGSSLIVDIPVTIEYNNPLKTAWLIARDKDKSKYELNIKSDIKIKNFENINVIPVEIDATGNMELVK